MMCVPNGELTIDYAKRLPQNGMIIQLWILLKKQMKEVK
jgi:hypothetical protein